MKTVQARNASRLAPTTDNHPAVAYTVSHLLVEILQALTPYMGAADHTVVDNEVVVDVCLTGEKDVAVFVKVHTIGPDGGRSAPAIPGPILRNPCGHNLGNRPISRISRGVLAEVVGPVALVATAANFVLRNDRAVRVTDGVGLIPAVNERHCVGAGIHASNQRMLRIPESSRRAVVNHKVCPCLQARSIVDPQR